MKRISKCFLCSLFFLLGLNQLIIGQTCGFPLNPQQSFDPNEIIGVYGYSNENYIVKRNHLNYTIYFENDAELATAPAQEILLIDTLDLTKFNPNDFSFGTFTFRDITVESIPNVTEFTKDIDMREFDEDIIVRITATFDKEIGIIRCHFIAYDPITMDLTENPFLGVLYPNTEPPIGEGNMTYRIGVLPSVTHGNIIANQAYIIFDLNEPIETNIWINTIDTIKPNSSMSYAPSGINDSTYIISWGGSDLGSGIRNYTVYMSKNDGEFLVWQYSTNATSDTLVGSIDSTYKFYCIATDNVGNREGEKEFDIQFKISNVSITEIQTEQGVIKVYPNPTNGQLKIETGQLTNTNYEIYNLMGQLQKQGKLQGETTTVNIESLANGMYILRIAGKAVKIIKE